MRGPIVAIHAIHLPNSQSGSVRLGFGRQIRSLASGVLVVVFDPWDRLPGFIRMGITDPHTRSQVRSMDADPVVATTDLQQHDSLSQRVRRILGELRKYAQAIFAVLLRPVACFAGLARGTCET